MSGTAEPVTPPATNAEWARDQKRRVESLESPTSQRVGEWVLSTSPDGNLIGSHVEGGSVILARRPTSGENDPDEISDPALPSLSATRTATQSIPGNGAVVQLDGVEVEAGGDWTRGQTSFEGVVVPRSGAYRCSGCVHFSSRDGTRYGVVIRVNGQTRASARFNDSDDSSWMSAHVSRILQLTAGDVVDLFAYSSGTSTIGANAFWATPTPCSLDLNMTTERE